MKTHSLLFRLLPFLCALAVTGQSRAQVLGWWQFNEQSPGTSASAAPGAILDASGNGQHLTAVSATNAPLPAYVAGAASYGTGAALKFSAATDDRVYLADTNTGPFDFGPNDSFTVEVLVRTTSAAIQAFAAKDYGSKLPSWWFRMEANGNVRFLVAQNGGPEPSVTGANKPINNGQWHHVAAVRDGTNKKLRVYVDYALANEANDTTTDTQANNQTLSIGAFNAGSRQFDGDMDFVRISSGALVPDQFVQALTYVTDLTPTNGATFVPVSALVTFSVKSPTIAVAQSGVRLSLNGADVSTQLQFSGTANDWQVSYSGLSANTVYQALITVTNQQGNVTTASTSFDTFGDALFMIEAEDYNFDGGQFIDHPVLASFPAADNYIDRIGSPEIDHHEVSAATVTQYRYGDTTGTVITDDSPRQKYLTAQQTDPGVADFNATNFVDGEWLNYTRTLPAATYRVYARVARAGSGDYTLKLDQVTSGSTGSSQTLYPLGRFRNASTFAHTYAFVPLSDAFGKPAAVPLGGLTTLRATFDARVPGMSANYFLFAPDTTGAQKPFLAEVRPAPGAENEAAAPQIFAALRHGNTTVTLSSIQMILDGVNVTASASRVSTAQGVTVSYQAAALPLGWHTARITFTDSAANSVTNEWQFMVANQAVRGHWNFNEKTAGEVAATNAGAILDASGNLRHGTATDPAMPYVTGSFNYSSTPGLHFTTGADRVVVPDVAGNFNFRGSFTLEAVVRTTSTATTPVLLAKNGTTGGEGEYWWRVPGATGGKQRIGLNDTTGGKFVSGTNTLNDGNWHHVAVVYDSTNSEIRLYADYQPDGALGSVVLTNVIGRTADLHIGSFVGGGNDFDGDIDFVRISNGALAPAEFVQTSVALPPIVKSVTPVADASFVAPAATVGAEIQNRDTQVALGSIKLWLDGTEVTGQSVVTATTDGATVARAATAAMAGGVHVATLIYQDNASPATSTTNTWQFAVAGSIPVLALYPFDEQLPGHAVSLAPDALLDASGNGHPATAATTNDPMAYISGSAAYGNTSALHFTTNDDHVFVPDATGRFNFTPTQSMTFEIILRTADIGQGGVGSLLCKQGAEPGEWWWRINATGFQQFWINDSAASKNITGVTALNDNLWHHVAAVYDAVRQELRLYVDYQLDGSPVPAAYASQTNIIGNAKDLWIGAFQRGDRQFDGDMDLVRVTGAALDPSWFVPLGGLPVTVSVQIVNVTLGANSIAFSFATVTGKSYIVESAPELTGGWSIEETVPGDNTTKTVSYPTSGLRKFFRLRIQ